MAVESNYDIYVRFYGTVKSGATLHGRDYGLTTSRGWTPFDEAQKLAVTIATDDVKEKHPIRSKTEVESEIKRLQS